MDMYQGMLMAAEDLTKRGEPVNIFPYDTKRKASATKKILENKGFENTDLIIGPLYPEPNALVDQYSVANRINKFNPISSNSDVVGENPFSFLMRPSYETMAVKCAEFAVAENKNPYAMIFYEQSARDSVFAAIYKQQLEEAGFEVVLFREITKDNSRQLLDTLWAQYDQYLTQEEADSIQEIREGLSRAEGFAGMKWKECHAILILCYPLVMTMIRIGLSITRNYSALHRTA